MNLVLIDGLNANEFEIIKKAKANENSEVFKLVNFDLKNINNYENITLYSGLFLNFVTSNLIFYVDKMINENIKKLQIEVVFVENLGENAKIAIDWLNSINERYSLAFKVKAEIDRYNLAEEMCAVSNNMSKISQNQADNIVSIYTDGACSGNPGAGGWGAILFHGSHKKEISGFEPNTTNNKMEITAVIRALELLKAPCTVELYSDSAYVVNAIKLGWLENWKKNNWLGSDKKQVKNIEYWKRLDELMQIHKVNFNKVKGHADNEFNNRCDELATGEIAAHANDL